VKLGCGLEPGIVLLLEKSKPEYEPDGPLIPISCMRAAFWPPG
jgi:hypothetical protein